jgi:hypothetical protein
MGFISRYQNNNIGNKLVNMLGIILINRNVKRTYVTFRARIARYRCIISINMKLNGVNIMFISE